MWWLFLAAEALLAWRMRREVWGRFLAFDLARGLALLALPPSGLAGSVWVATEPVSLALQFLAVGPVLTAGMRSDGRWPRLALYAAGLAAVAFSLGSAPLEAPWVKLDHHAMVFGRRLAVAILLGALILSAALAALARLPRDSARAWLIAYYVLQVASIEAIAIMGPGYIRPVNTAHAVVVAVLFVAWATGETSARVRQPQ